MDAKYLQLPRPREQPSPLVYSVGVPYFLYTFQKPYRSAGPLR